MPTYEFECPAGHRFDKFFRKMSEAADELPCPECCAPAKRLISGGAGLHFKGSGFYITDYGKGGKKPAASSGASEGSAGATDGAAKSGDGKSDAKSAPEKKPDNKPTSKE